MGKTLQDKLSELPAESRQRVQAETNKLIAEEMNLRELRNGLALTQTKIAAELGIGQDEVSRAERRADMLVSTLRNFIRAMGGDLDIVARFPDHPDVHISRLGDVLEDDDERRVTA